MTIKINCENQNKRRKTDLLKAKKVARGALRALGKDSARLNITFFSNQKIRAFHRRYLGKDMSTDVMAFPAGKEGDFLGDIAISSDKAAQNAKTYGLTFKEEIALYVIHGILHLAGYDDTTARKRARMKRKENELLQQARKSL